jgi:hypothetical protein
MRMAGTGDQIVRGISLTYAHQLEQLFTQPTYFGHPSPSEFSFGAGTETGRGCFTRVLGK